MRPDWSKPVRRDCIVKGTAEDFANLSDENQDLFAMSLLVADEAGMVSREDLDAGMVAAAGGYLRVEIRENLWVVLWDPTKPPAPTELVMVPDSKVIQ